MAASVAGHIMRRLSENVFIKQVKVAGAITDGVYPGANAYIDVQKFGRFAFLVAVGATDDTAVTAKVVQATAVAGTGSKDITGAAITSTTLAGANDNKFAIIEVQQSRLDIANGFRYVALSVAATGGTATEMAVFFFGWRQDVLPPVFGTDLAETVFIDG